MKNETIQHVKKTEYEKHLQTKKHNDTNNDTKIDVNKFKCICGLKYTNRHNLYRHRRTCEKLKNSEITAEMMKNSITEETILKLIEQNNELLKKMSEMSVQPIVNNITNNHNNIELNNKNHK